MIDNCNCCDGLDRITPQSRYNRPGLAALKYRVGTYSAFLETMLARLTTLDLSDDPEQMLRPLLELTTRELDDSSIALLDAWAVLADVLTFYQERLANEGYLRTAQERRSILELGRLVGYELRPGVAASVFLAFTVEEPDPQKPILIPAGTRVQSLPNPGELPQSFETSEELVARVAWNAMRPRLSQPQVMQDTTNLLYLQGIATNLKPNDPLLVLSVDAADKVNAYFRRVFDIQTNPQDDITTVSLSAELSFNELNELLFTNEPPAISNKITLIVPYPSGVSDIPVQLDKVTLEWTGESSGGFVVTFGVLENDVPASPLIREFVSKNTLALNEVSSTSLDELKDDTAYYWQVTLSDDPQKDPCADSRPIWKFKTVPSLTLNLLSPHNVDIEMPDTPDELTVNFSWEWLSQIPTGTVNYSIQISQDPDFKIILTEFSIVDSTEATYPSAGNANELITLDTYYWRVIPSGSFEPMEEVPQSSFQLVDLVPPEEDDDPVIIVSTMLASTINENDPKRQEIAREVVKHIFQDIQNFVTIEIETSDEPIPRLQAQIDIKADALMVYTHFFEFLNQLENTTLDYCIVLAWLKNLTIALIGDTGTKGGIKGLLGLRRGLLSNSTRIYPKQFVNFEIIVDIEDEFGLNTGTPGKKPSLPTIDVLVGYPDQAFTYVINELNVLFNFLRDESRPVSNPGAGVNREDEDIKAIKSLQDKLKNLLEILEILSEGGTNEWDEFKKWIDNPDTEQLGLLQWLEKILTDTPSIGILSKIVPQLIKPRSQQPANALQLIRDVQQIFDKGSDITPRLLTALNQSLKGSLYNTWAKTEVASISSLQGIEVLRKKAAPYGARIPRSPIYEQQTNAAKEKVLVLVGYEEPQLSELIDEENRTLLTLDAEYSQIVPGSNVVIEWPEEFKSTLLTQSDPNYLIIQIKKVRTVAKPDVGQLTQLVLDQDWTHQDDSIDVVRNAAVYIQSESLPLAEETFELDVAGGIVWLDGLYDGLEAGRWFIISGERTDIPGTTGVVTSERVMVAGVKQSIQQIKVGDNFIPLQSDKIYTTIELATPLAYTYKRDTVTIYGNVVKATHGETREEVLGHGDGSQARQGFTLKQPPLTYLAAPTRQGTESTLEVRVNNIRWPEKENLLELGPEDRGYVTRTDNEQNTTVIFGDGLQGKRLPTGVENVKAVYRNGIGQTGNVAAEQISQLSIRPLGVKGVINPLAASGGADPETADQARWNVPRALLALDRLVSVSDYEDFARTFAGISKASAAKLFEGRQEVIHLSIAGVNDIPIAEDSDLYRALFDALERYGTLQLPLRIETRTLKLLVLIAKVKIQPDYLWEVVEPELRAVLLDTFSFERREIGQDARVSEAISVMQTIRGVEYIDVDVFTSISETEAKNPDDLFKTLSNIATDAASGEKAEDAQVDLADDQEDQIKQAEIAYLSPDVPDTLILKEIK